MALNLYRRHRRECKAERVEDFRSGEFQERQKGWKRCDCPIFASGALARRFKRRNTREFTWEGARAVAAIWAAADSWDDPGSVPANLLKDAPEEHGKVTVERAVTAYLAEHHKQSAPNTIKKYTLLMDRLKSFSAEKGYISLNRWTPQDVREMRDSWTISTSTANKHMAVIKAFFSFCLSNEWLDRNPATLVRAPRGRSSDDGRSAQKTPFSDAEIDRMLQACRTKYGKQEVKWSRTVHHREVTGEYVRYNFKWTGADLEDFILIAIHTGLRISDLTTFHVGRLTDTGEIHIRTTKTGVKVFCWVPEWLQERILERARRVGPFIFGEHSTKDMNVITDVWRRKLIKLWSLCEGPDFTWKEKPTPHRLRHSFARILLQRPGVTVRDVAELMGDTEEMVLRHYGAWVPERQERLTGILKNAFRDRSYPNVVEIGKKTGTEDK
jgi:integrase